MAFGGNGGVTETRTMKWILGAGLVLLSIGIGSFNTWGAWVRSQHISWTLVVVGAEVMMFVALGLGVIATTWVRKGACFIITAALAWFCVQNGKFAVKEMFAEIYESEAGERLDPETLERQAVILNSRAPSLEAAAAKAEDNRSEELSRVRRAIAELETERGLMLVQITDPSQFNQQVLRAQQSLQARGEYGGDLDGIYGELTKQAMLSRGADISTELKVLKAEESALNPSVSLSGEEVNLQDIGALGVVLTPAQKARAGAAKLREQAKEIRAINAWGERALWVVEIARSFSVWAFLMTVTASSTSSNRAAPQSSDKEEEPGQGEGTKASGVPQTQDSEPELTPANDPNAPLTRSQIGKLGADARKHYAEAIEAGKIEIPPPDNMTNRREAA